MECFDSGTLIEDYLKRLQENQVAFLKGEETRETRRGLIKLFEELLILVRDEGYPNRETLQLGKAKEIWRILMVHAIRHISTVRNVRGFNDLYAYYLKSVDLEDLLFGIDPMYRDHTMHVLWVYLLGDQILHGDSCIGRIGSKDWGIICPADLGGEAEPCEMKSRMERDLLPYEDSVFCIAALCHDLAYHFEKIEKVNQRIEDMSKFLGLRAFERLRYSFSMEQSLLVSKLIELMSLKAFVRGRDHIEFIRDDPTFVDMSQSFEQRKHGVLSSYLLYRLIDTMGEITLTDVQNLPDSYETAKHLIIRKAVLYTISSHTCDYAFSVSYNNFRFLLCLFDELEEFSRYARLGRGAVNEICKSSLGFTGDGEFAVSYLFEENHVANPESFFFARAKRFCRMIEVEQGTAECAIKSFLMTCIDRKTAPDAAKPLQYRLRIDHQGAFCIVPGKTGDDWHRISPDPEMELKRLL